MSGKVFKRLKAPAPISLEKSTYWKFRAQLAECLVNDQQIEKAFLLNQERRQAAFKAVGLDPARVYDLNDKNCTATPK